MILQWKEEIHTRTLVHVLKTIDPYFNDVCKGIKFFEFRPYDRPFKVDDYLELYHYPQNDRYISCKISYVLSRFDDRFIWFDENIKGCILGIKDIIVIDAPIHKESGTYTLGGERVEPINSKGL